MYHTHIADTIFHGGRIFTWPWLESRPSALAVRSGRVLAVGPDDEMRDFQGGKTETVNCAGKLIIPGFQDAHIHPVMAGCVLSSCYLLDVSGRRATLDAIAEYRSHLAQGLWLRGWGWKQEDFPAGEPDRFLLDGITGPVPAYLTRADGHAAWANSSALQASGITDSTPDPSGGRLERDAHGHVTGVLHEAAMKLVQQAMPPYTTDELAEALRRSQSHLFSLGITGWQDASVEGDELRAYKALASSGELKAHVTGALRWDQNRGVEQIADLEERRQRYENSNLDLHTVKIMVDGVIEGSRTAALIDPYLDPVSGNPTDNRGQTFLTKKGLEDAVSALTGRGFQLHFHAIGDRAVHYALDALQHAYIEHGSQVHHPVISHIQLIDRRAIPRFSQLGALASMQPFWAAHDSTQDGMTIHYIGLDRAEHEYPFRDLCAAHTIMAGGSDWMISSAYPIDGIHVAVNRKHYIKGSTFKPSALQVVPQALYIKNAITLAQGMTAYTYGTAVANSRQQITGRIAPGYNADFTILDSDPFLHQDDEIGSTGVYATYINGTPVYSNQ